MTITDTAIHELPGIGYLMTYYDDEFRVHLLDARITDVLDAGQIDALITGLLAVKAELVAADSQIPQPADTFA